MDAVKNLWYKNAIVYSLDVETFMDSDGNGIGDFQGLTKCLDHLSGIGITCLWLLPFYSSPNRDNGYDVMDYYNVDPRLGTLGDFVEFMHQARERGIRVIVDLVVNHTSIQHPWFGAAIPVCWGGSRCSQSPSLLQPVHQLSGRPARRILAAVHYRTSRPQHASQSAARPCQ